MPPHSIPSADLDAILAEGLAEAGDAARAAWARIRIDPGLWRCPEMADEEGGFWAVAILGAEVIWTNHIEDGFNTSRCSSTIRSPGPGSTSRTPGAAGPA